jgi:hypothetical protein
MADEAGTVRSRKPVEKFIRALTESPGQAPTTHLLHRGDPEQPRQQVSPGGLTVLDDRLPLRSSDLRLATTGRRLALANWLTDASNPLTARVLVNRIWLGHFGRGLVGTPADFGRLGERPTHPALLDWLAHEFMTHGWSLKHMHRLIMTSAAYRQSSHPNGKGPQSPVEDLARFPVHRLDAEVIRDSILSVAGTLSHKMYGPPVPVRETDEGLVIVGKGMKDLARGTTLPEPLAPGEEFRRSIYVSARRSMPLTVLASLDAPVMEPNCAARVRSTTPISSLLLMNDPFLEVQANAFALRLQHEFGNDPRRQFARAWRLVYGATPSESDLARVLPYLAELEQHFRGAAPKGTAIDPKQKAMATVCWALLNSSRFLFLE